MNCGRLRMRLLKMASRASKLALVQSDHIRSLLKNLSDCIEISLMKFSTKGDRDKSDFLWYIVQCKY